MTRNNKVRASERLVEDKRIWASGIRTLAGTDEAGRGCLAGPVVAAAVIFEPGSFLDGVDDSKNLARKNRTHLFEQICEQAVSVGIGVCSPAEIDRMNILFASLEAMRRAISDLEPHPDYVFIDGNREIPGLNISSEVLIKGDSRSFSIAAASIVAKETRDRLMEDLHISYPLYGLDRHKGYPTKEHYRALAKYGATPHHRKSFKLFREDGQPDLFASSLPEGTV